MKNRIAIAILAVFALSSASHAQELGRQLYAQGIRQTVALKDGTGRSLVGTFHPEVPLTGDFYLTRYGFSQKPLGTLRGPEGTSPEDLTEMAAAGQLAGLPRTYVATPTDWVDARVLRVGTQSWWSAVVDPALAALHAPVIPPPAACVTPKVCMVPPGACGPTCDAPKTCMDRPEPCAPPLTLIPVSPDALSTICAAPAWVSSIRLQQRRRLQAACDWLKMVEAVKVKL